MEIILNGDPLEVPEGTSLSALLENLGQAGRRVAVEINREIVPRSLHAETPLAAGDRVEIVQAIGGG